MKQTSKQAAIPADVYVFGTCIVDVAFADAGMDAIAVLESMGIRVHYPEQQTCCGQPAMTSGATEQARAVARAQLGLFPEPWPIVVLSGSCTGMFRHHYTQLFAAPDPDHGLAIDVSSRAVEWMEFLASCPPLVSRNATPVKVVVHTACSAQRETNTRTATESVLGHWEQVQVVTADHATECCGFGGTFSVRYPDISNAMVTDKCDALLATQAERIVSSDCACLMNINGKLAKRQDALQGEHIATLVRDIVLGDRHD
jgi:L-lactate dehydrogenase complex protein LldE